MRSGVRKFDCAMNERIPEHDSLDYAGGNGASGYLASQPPPLSELWDGVPLSNTINGVCSATLSPASGDLAEVATRHPLRRVGTYEPLGGTAKRALDIVIAVISIILLSPLMIIVAGLIRLAMGTPLLFAHTRIGYNGQPFRCYKFRTMVPNADACLSDHLRRDPDAALEWSKCRKLQRDPRVTTLGLLLRKSSIDELPQLFNVLRGEMSCVGPRPIVDEELQRYGRSLTEYLKARPGLTGLWQTGGRNKTTYERRVALDCDYVRNWSLWLDARILIKTIFVLANFDESA